MKGPSNIETYVTRHVYHAVKEHLQPQLDRLAAYEKLAKDEQLAFICQGCKFPYSQDHSHTTCRRCVIILKCDRPDCNPYLIVCPSCDRSLCNRHVNAMHVTVCCKRNVCVSCLYQCIACNANVCYFCIDVKKGIRCQKCVIPVH